MNKKLILLTSYFLITPIFILTLVMYQLFLHNQNSSITSKAVAFEKPKIQYKSIPDVPIRTEIAFSSQEARVEVLEEFFGRYDSPLLPYAQKIVEEADKYDLDYRLLPAIAMQESTLCLKAPKGTNNCWGFGIYGKKKTGFTDFGQAIEVISKTMAEKYHAQGLRDPHEIMTKYTPSNNGEWAENVSYVMDRIEASL